MRGPLAGDLVGVRADVEREQASRGSARRTASIAACAVKVLLAGRSAAWKALRCSARAAGVQELVLAGSAARRASEASRSPVTSCASFTEGAMSTGSMSTCSSGTSPIQASYSTSTVS